REPGSEVSAKVQMQHIGLEAPQQPHQRRCALWIIDAVPIFASVACEIDRQALMTGLPQQIANRDKIGLHPAVRRRIRPELHDLHRTIGTGAPFFADAISARQPSVARAPSRTVTAGARPFRILSAKSSICAKYPLSGHIFDFPLRVPFHIPVRLKSSLKPPTPCAKT